MRGGPRSLVEEVEFFCLLGKRNEKEKEKNEKTKKTSATDRDPFLFFNRSRRLDLLRSSLSKLPPNAPRDST